MHKQWRVFCFALHGIIDICILHDDIVVSDDDSIVRTCERAFLFELFVVVVVELLLNCVCCCYFILINR